MGYKNWKPFMLVRIFSFFWLMVALLSCSCQSVSNYYHTDFLAPYYLHVTSINVCTCVTVALLILLANGGSSLMKVSFSSSFWIQAQNDLLIVEIYQLHHFLAVPIMYPSLTVFWAYLFSHLYQLEPPRVVSDSNGWCMLSHSYSVFSNE